MLAYNLMSVFRHTVMRQTVHHTLATLHHKVLAVGAFWDNPKVKPDKPTLRLAVARQRRHWFEPRSSISPICRRDPAKFANDF